METGIKHVKVHKDKKAIVMASINECRKETFPQMTFIMTLV
jgi:hypothetical protein